MPQLWCLSVPEAFVYNQAFWELRKMISSLFTLVSDYNRGGVS